MAELNIIHEFSLMFIALIVAYFIYRAYAYLGNLDNCKCAPKKIVNNLKMIELYYLIIILGGILFNVVYLIFNIDYTQLFTKYKYLVGFIVIYILSVFGVFLYYVYNVIEFKSKLDPKCACANQWQNDIIYLHVLYLSLPIILTILSALFKFKINTSVVTLVIVALVAIYYYEQYIVSKGKITESMISMLGSYTKMVFEPTIYNNEAQPFDVKNGAKNPDYGDFATYVAQPLQQYHQMHPDEYPASEPYMGDLIYTPLSTHESIMMEFRKQPPKIVLT